MVAFDTVNRIHVGEPFAERALSEYLERLAQSWGLQTQRLAVADDAYNLLVTASVDPRQPWRMFDSHLDTVAVDGMIVDPFGAEIRDGKLYGRGACDTKGTGAAMLWALKSAAAERALPVNVALLFSIDEEVTRTGVRAFASRQLDALDWRPQVAIVGEPTGLQMVTAHNGLVRWRIRTKGVAVHSSDPSRGRSAISDMCRVIDAIESEYIPHLAAEHPLVGKAQCSVNLIEGGAQINIIPEFCTIMVDRRVVPGENGDKVLPAVENVLQALRDEDPALEVEQLEARIEAGLSPDANQPLAERVGQILMAAGLSTEQQGAKYGTHASTLAEAGIPSLVLGPGNIVQAHSKDEFLALDQLEIAVDVYRAIMTAAEII